MGKEEGREAEAVTVSYETTGEEAEGGGSGRLTEGLERLNLVTLRIRRVEDEGQLGSVVSACDSWSSGGGFDSQQRSMLELPGESNLSNLWSIYSSVK
ncbi:hypothetical protein ElyMa_006145400 [Elysia marginata]|uniref:Uncharacterized protein n=1 Tax=Elysia marginata TaxID=1093978 RepID=A0AAV4GYI7_9GAST|nr:hypothetical protein ElyMa_006145400 [Elysia marginata]